MLGHVVLPHLVYTAPPTLGPGGPVSPFWPVGPLSPVKSIIHVYSGFKLLGCNYVVHTYISICFCYTCIVEWTECIQETGGECTGFQQELHFEIFNFRTFDILNANCVLFLKWDWTRSYTYILECTYWPGSPLYYYPWVSLLPLCSRRSDWPWQSITTISSIPPMLVH